MANYPQLDNARGVWNMKEVYDAVMGGYWPNALSRALIGGGETPTVVNVIQKITMSSTGDAADFGDLVSVKRLHAPLSSFTRGIWAGGATPSGTAAIDYVSIMSDGNAADFGDLTNARYASGGSSNSTRGMTSGGYISARSDVIDYVTMASTGDAIDFGNLTDERTLVGSTTSTTRSCTMGGQHADSSQTNIIDFVEIATLGNSTDFGDLSSANYRCSGTASSSTRGVVNGGFSAPGSTTNNRIEYITTASQGNAIDYGDSTIAGYDKSGTSNSVRGLFMGAYTQPGDSNIIEYIAISAGGTATDFGDLTTGSNGHAAVSNAHGGLNDGYQGTRMPVVGASTRAVMGSGKQQPANSIGNFIEYIDIATGGDNAADFGDLSASRTLANACASTTRGCFGGGATPSKSDIIDYVTIATTGNATDFGNLQDEKQEPGSASNATRGIWFGGWSGSGSPYAGTDEIDYITIASTGDASDFGNLSAARRDIMAATASPTRAVTGGGWIVGNSDVGVNILEYVTIGSTGDVTDFGDLTNTWWDGFATGSSTRGLFGGGYRAPDSGLSTIDYITIASTGNAASFGELATKGNASGATSNNIRGIVCGGGTGPGGTGQTRIGYVTIATLGNENDFGDLHTGYDDITATSANHGGLQ